MRCFTAPGPSFGFRLTGAKRSLNNNMEIGAGHFIAAEDLNTDAFLSFGKEQRHISIRLCAGW